MNRVTLLVALSCAAVLTACGGGGNESTDSSAMSAADSPAAVGAAAPRSRALAAAVNSSSVTVGTFAGTAGTPGTFDGTGAAARFTYPAAIAADAAGNLYVGDRGNGTLRKITPAGIVTTLASFDSKLSSPNLSVDNILGYQTGIAVDVSGNVYFADNYTIRKLTPAGVLSTLAGVAGDGAFVDGAGASARFGSTQGIALDAAGNVFLVDGQSVRKLDSSGVVTTIAGVGGVGGAADGQGAAARFQNPYGLTIDLSGNLYVADTANGTIRKVTPSGLVTTLAGTAGSSGTADGTGAAARLSGPYGITLDPIGNLFVTDLGAIRMLTPAGVVRTIAGAGGVVGSVDGTGTTARFFLPIGIAADIGGNLYVADAGNNVIRKLTGAATPVTSTTPTFPDDFNRPDGVVGNGWSSTSGNLGGDLLIRNGMLSTPGPDGRAAIYRSIDLSSAVSVSATITQKNGFGGLLDAYATGFLIGSNGSLKSGYGIYFSRSDQSYANSTVSLTLDEITIASVPSSFQFGASITVNVTFAPDRSVTGSVSGDGNTFNFSFGPRALTLAGSNFAIDQGFSDGRSTVILNPTLDNLLLTTAAAKVDLSPPPLARPEATTTLPSGARNLAVVIHGWTDSSSAPWVKDIIQRICQRLGSPITVAYSAEQIPTYQCSTATWDVKSFDWSKAAAQRYIADCSLPNASSASTPSVCSNPQVLKPSGAYANAYAIGATLASNIRQGNYRHVHFIAHSAGSNVAQTAIDTLASWSVAPPATHVTFLDAYYPFDPFGQVPRYGSGATWAEQYVDTRPLSPLFLLEPFDTTNTYLTKSFNFDVTSLDTRQEPAPPDYNSIAVRRHYWPVDYYACSILTGQSVAPLPDGFDCSTIAASSRIGFGFSLSLESGANFQSSLVRFPTSQIAGEASFCKPPFNVQCVIPNAAQLKAATIGTFPFISNLPIVSPTGTSQTTPSTINGSALQDITVALGTGSPAWIQIPITTTDRTNLLKFGYSFTSQAEGLLTVAVDGQMVFMADERFSTHDALATPLVPVPTLAPGSHVLSFRLDPFSALKSSVVINGIHTFRTDLTQVARLAGDLNGDGVIDCRDLLIVGLAIGSKAGQQRFDPRADINADGIVDFRDLQFVLSKITSKAAAFCSR